MYDWNNMTDMFQIWKVEEDNWIVSLPHQCDEWEISTYESSHEEAVRLLENFIEDANIALEDLKNRKERNAE